jgi:hypothetical protein
MGVGRKPKTLEMKILTGNPGKRSLKKNRAVAPAGKLRMPPTFRKKKHRSGTRRSRFAARGAQACRSELLIIASSSRLRIKRQAHARAEVMAKDNAQSRTAARQRSCGRDRARMGEESADHGHRYER